MGRLGSFARDRDGYVRWVRVTDGPLLVLAVVFLIVLVIPAATSLPRPAEIALQAANVVIWAAFAVDYFARLYLAADRREYVKRNLVDLLVVVVPFLRPIRALRLLRLLRAASVGGMLSRRTASLHARVSTYVTSAAAVAIIVASVGIHDAEHDAAGANIHTLGDALWWSATTITTVGYGDRYPTTPEGRMIAVGLMLVGIALLGVITATIAAWFVARLEAVEAEAAKDDVTLDLVLAELQRLHSRLDRLETRSGST